MKVKAKVVFFDETGLHKIGDVVEVANCDSRYMEELPEAKPEKKTPKVKKEK